MNLQDFGSIGELIAALATVVTLAYLAVQIRSNTTAVKVEGRRATRAMTTAMRVAIAQDGELARIFNAGLADFSKLNPEEKTRFIFALSDFVTAAAGVYDEFRLGIQSEDQFETQRNAIGPFLTAPGGREFWRLFGKRYSAPFQEWVAKELFREQTK
jgi:hypothetical protein